MTQWGALLWNRNHLPRGAQCNNAALCGQGGSTPYEALRCDEEVSMPAIGELTRIEPVHLARLEAQGIFTTGLLLERSETPTRRQTLADQTDATLADVDEWRDEALLLNLAFFGRPEHELLAAAGISGIRALAESDWDEFQASVMRATAMLGRVAPDPLSLRSWWEQGRVLVDA